MDPSSICFSPGAIAILAAIGGVIQATIVALFVQLMRAKDAQIVKAEAREAEWRRLAVRGAEDIIPPLVRGVRERTRDQMRELREP